MRWRWPGGWRRRRAERPAPAIVLPPDVPSALAVQKIEALRAAGYPLEPDVRRAWEQAVRLHRAVYGHLPDYRPPPDWEDIGPFV